MCACIYNIYIDPNTTFRTFRDRTTMYKIQRTLDGPHSSLDIEKQHISELEEVAIETIHNETQRKHNF